MEIDKMICQCGHHRLSHRDKGYDADVAGSMPGQGSCTEDGCLCTQFSNMLNCPFCGERPDCVDKHRVHCVNNECGIYVKLMNIRDWNRRFNGSDYTV